MMLRFRSSLKTEYGVSLPQERQDLSRDQAQRWEERHQQRISRRSWSDDKYREA
jgi:hypothetical protein